MPHRRALVALLGVSLLGCAPSAGPSTVGATPAPSAAVVATAGPSAPSQPTPEHPVPMELQGAWQAQIANGDSVILTLTETGYTIRRTTRLGSVDNVATGRGRVEVDGEAALFSNSNLCVGEGRYTWSIVGGVLLFVSVDEDACPNRSGVIDGFEYTRAE